MSCWRNWRELIDNVQRCLTFIWKFPLLIVSPFLWPCVTESFKQQTHTHIYRERWREKREDTSTELRTNQKRKFSRSQWWWKPSFGCLEDSKSPECMLWLFQSKGERPLGGKKNASLSGGRMAEIVIHATLSRKKTLHLVHLCLQSLSANNDPLFAASGNI